MIGALRLRAAKAPQPASVPGADIRGDVAICGGAQTGGVNPPCFVSALCQRAFAISARI